MALARNLAPGAASQPPSAVDGPAPLLAPLTLLTSAAKDAGFVSRDAFGLAVGVWTPCNCSGALRLAHNVEASVPISRAARAPQNKRLQPPQFPVFVAQPRYGRSFIHCELRIGPTHPEFHGSAFSLSSSNMFVPGPHHTELMRHQQAHCNRARGCVAATEIPRYERNHLLNSHHAARVEPRFFLLTMTGKVRMNS